MGSLLQQLVYSDDRDLQWAKEGLRIGEVTTETLRCSPPQLDIATAGEHLRRLFMFSSLYDI